MVSGRARYRRCRRCKARACIWRCPIRTGFSASSKSLRPRCWRVCIRAAFWSAPSWPASCIWWRPACPRWRPRPPPSSPTPPSLLPPPPPPRRRGRRRRRRPPRPIRDMLEPVAGRDNVKAQVTADVDFTQTESSSEQFRPNQQPESGAVRSQQLLESRSGANKLPTGIPGAVSNQPPVPSTAPINGPNPAPNAGGQQGPDEQTNKRESTTNYELDRTVRVVRGSTGTVKRLSAAVVVNYQSVLDKGRAVSRALTPEQIGQMTALVRESIGFDSARGDSVNLMN